MGNCLVCGKPDPEKAMAFRGEDWCCDRHRKMILGEITRETISAKQENLGGLYESR